jgi:hypothetical protein
MKKLTLDLDRIDVQSFQTADAGREGGTVLGNDVLATPGHSCLRTACCPPTYDLGETCAC